MKDYLILSQKRYLLFILFWIFYSCISLSLYAQITNQRCDNGNLQGVIVTDRDNGQLCSGFLFYSFTIELDLLNGPQGNEYEFVTKGPHFESQTHGLGYDIREEFIIRPDFGFISGCEPIRCDLFLDVFCSGENGVLLSDIYIATLTLYPFLSVQRNFPDCLTGDSGSAYVVDRDGNICSETVTGNPGTSGVCDGVDGTLSYNFVIHENTPCERTESQTITTNCNTGVMGCTDSAACNYDPDAVCDNGTCYSQSPCCPSPISHDVIQYLCSTDSIMCIDFDGNVEGVFDVFGLTNDENALYGTINSAMGNTVCINVINYNRTCDLVYDTSFSLIYTCKNSFDIFTYDLGTISVFPIQSFYKPRIDNYVYSVCEPIPDVFPSTCPSDLQVEIIQPVEDCQNPVDGKVIWTSTPLFDFSLAPECSFILTDTIDIAPCSLRPENGQLSIKKVEE